MKASTIDNELCYDSRSPWWNDNFLHNTFLYRAAYYRSQQGRTDPPWHWPLKTKLYWHVDSKQQQWRDEHCPTKKKLRIHKRVTNDSTRLFHYSLQDQ
jgi:hypothetical protein